jgi:hypothetical protein
MLYLVDISFIHLSDLIATSRTEFLIKIAL